MVGHVLGRHPRTLEGRLDPSPVQPRGEPVEEQAQVRDGLVAELGHVGMLGGQDDLRGKIEQESKSKSGVRVLILEGRAKETKFPSRPIDCRNALTWFVTLEN